MNEGAKKIWANMWPIVISALLAGALGFGQSLAASAGLCADPTLTATETGALGGMIKALHTMASGLLKGHA